MRVLRFNLFLLGIFTLAFLCSFVFSQERVEKGVNENLIFVPTIVLDKEGNFVEGLTTEDFEIYEDGKRQKLTLFAVKKVSDVKLQIEGEENEKFREILGKRTVAIVLDEKLSHPSLIPQIKEAVENFSSKFLSGDDTVLIFAAENWYIWERSDLAEEGRSDWFRHPESPREKLLSIAEELGKKEGEKIALLLWKGDYSWFADPSMMTKAFNASNCKVYFMDLRRVKESISPYSKESPVSGTTYSYVGGTSAGPDTFTSYAGRTSDSTMKIPIFDSKDLINLSEDTGGIAFSKISDLQKGLEMIGEKISKTYILGYIPESKAKAGEYRKIKVKVNKKGLKVLHRRGYIVR